MAFPGARDYRSHMLHASCHCGAVRIDVSRAPRSLTECTCSICRRLGARWAYYTRPALRFHHAKGALAGYTYKTHTFRYCHCRRCGCVTHYERVGTADDNRVALNARMIDPPEAIAAVKVRVLDVRRI